MEPERPHRAGDYHRHFIGLRGLLDIILMSEKLWRLTVRDDFSAGHALRHYEGKCERMHGHNFAVELTVEGNRLAPQTEMLLDFKIFL